jgi:phospholipid-binding lipoprotein MlaA
MFRRWLRVAACSALIFAPLFLFGCASAGQTPTDQTNNDPYESFNRKVWWVDIKLYHYFLRPVALGYRDYTPQVLQTATGNILRNLKTPLIMVNNLLQGNFSLFGDNFARLALNTTLGLGGMIDVGSKANLPYKEADLGQTFGAWGIDSGPYLVLPILGPSDPRDGIAYGIEAFGDPFSLEMRAHGYDDAVYLRAGVQIIDDQAQIVDQYDEMEKNSLDFYAAVRSLYQQSRAGMVQAAKGGGNNAPVPSIIYGTDDDSVTPSAEPTPSKTPSPSVAPGSSAAPAPSSDSGKAKQ